MTERKKRDGVILVIALFKFAKALLLIAVGLAAFNLLRPGVGEAAERWLSTVSSSIGRHAVQHVLSHITSIPPRRLEMIGAGAWAYALLFMVEGTGLWMRKRWAEYLTVFATATFVPFEIFELTHGVSGPKVLTLLINIAVIAYLAFRLRARKS